MPIKSLKNAPEENNIYRFAWVICKPSTSVEILKFIPNSSQTLQKKKKNIVPEKHHVEPKQSVLFFFFFERMLAGYF